MKQHLLILCDAMAAHSGLSHWQIGRRALKNVRFFHDLRRGQGCTLTSYERAMLWFGEQWPAGLTWPVGVPRLAPPESDAKGRENAA